MEKVSRLAESRASLPRQEALLLVTFSSYLYNPGFMALVDILLVSW
jgi:hypothetical protein